jgi:hypothetical protein
LLTPWRNSFSDFRAARGAEQRPGFIACNAGGGDVLIQKGFQLVMTGRFVFLAAYLVQTHPAAPPLREVVADIHLQHRADADECVDHDADQRAVAQGGQRVGVDDCQQRAPPRDPAPAFFPSSPHAWARAPRGAGLVSRTWPTARQSNSMRIAARCCFTVGFETPACSCSM